jgi:hypothetical protein
VKRVCLENDTSLVLPNEKSNALIDGPRNFLLPKLGIARITMEGRNMERIRSMKEAISKRIVMRNPSAAVWEWRTNAGK